MPQVDWAGLAIFVTALAGAIVSVGTFFRQGIIAKQAKADRDATNVKVDAVGEKTESLHVLVNEQQSKLNEVVHAAVAGQAHAEGYIEGNAEKAARQEST